MRDKINNRAMINKCMRQTELDRFKKELEDCGARLIILFGSTVTGNTGIDSDIDLIVVMESEDDFLSRTGKIYQLLKPRVAADILVYTPEEFTRLSYSNPIIRIALKEGQVIYEKN